MIGHFRRQCLTRSPLFPRFFSHSVVPAGQPAVQQVTMSVDAQHRIRTALARSASDALLEEAAARAAAGGAAGADRPGSGAYGGAGGGFGGQQGYASGARPSNQMNSSYQERPTSFRTSACAW